MKLDQLPVNEYPNFFATYINALQDTQLIEDLEISVHQFIKFVQNIPMDKFDYRYEPNKWTIKDIIQHLIDAERIFAYRSLRIARGDQTPLPSFDENIYAENTDANQRSIQDLLTEMAVVRQATLFLFKTFSEQQLQNQGTVSNNTISVRAIGFIIIGHQQHHQNIFQERYL
jgi:uncharacterized damage-inducible protein DinB